MARQQYLRCRVCGGPAFDCKCWTLEGARSEVRRCRSRLALGDLDGVALVSWKRQLAAALRLEADAEAAVMAYSQTVALFSHA